MIVRTPLFVAAGFLTATLVPATARRSQESVPLTIQQPQQVVCLHGEGETAEQRARRNAAVGAARAINTAQSEEKRRGGPFRTLPELGFNMTALSDQRFKDAFKTGEFVPGFSTRHTTDGQTYAFTVVDETDPCRLAYFSDDRGVIFQGQPIGLRTRQGQ